MTSIQHLTKRRTRLTKLRLDEVSVVDRGANPMAEILIAKRHDADALPPGGDEQITKAAAESLMETKAHEIAKRDGISFAQAYRKVFHDHPELYEATITKRGGDSEQKATDWKAAEKTLRELATARMLKTREPFGVAYRAVMETPEGRKLYAVAAG